MAARQVLREQRLRHVQSDYPDHPGRRPGRRPRPAGLAEILRRAGARRAGDGDRHAVPAAARTARVLAAPVRRHPARSEEHTSELQSLMRISYAVFCLKKKKKKNKTTQT